MSNTVKYNYWKITMEKLRGMAKTIQKTVGIQIAIFIIEEVDAVKL